MIRRRKHGILSAMLAASLALTSMTTVLAAAPVPTDDEAIALLQSYGIIKGDQFGNLNLEQPIKRAEAATIFVRAMGQESTAPLMASLVPFEDAKGHWGAGYIAVAYRLNIMKGRSDTMFDPEALITNQEVYTVLLRLVQREPLGAWNPQQIMQIAADLGLTPAGINPGVLGPAQALRGTIFRSLGKAASSLELADGRTVLSTYVDFLPPTLRLDAPPSAVGTSSVRLTGTAQGAAYILVGTQKVAVGNGDRFTVDVPLNPGTNTFEIKAVDWAGNVSSQTVSVTRAGAAASIIVVGEVSVKAGQTVPLQAVAYDANNIALPASEVSATVSGNLGSYNAANGTFTAGNNAGTGTITFKAGGVTKEVSLSVLGLSAQAKSLRIKNADQVTTTIGKFGTVTVEVLDDQGNVVTSDDGRTISLTATGLTGVSISNATAVTQKGAATFTVSGNKEGTASLAAASNGLGTATGSLTVATSTRIVLSTVATNPVANGTTPIFVRAQLVNEKGENVANTTGNDIRIEINTTSPTTYASSNLVVISRGKFSSEGSDAALTPGLVTETVGISGKVISSGHNFSVVGTSVRVTEVKIGAPVKMELVNSSGARTPGQPISLTVRVVDSNGNLVPTGSYGFQVTATTTNGETALPSAASATVGGYSVEKGVTGAQVGRTKAGTATVSLTYPKSGRVTLKVVPVLAQTNSVDSNGEFGDSASATHLQAGEAVATWSTTPDHVVLKWEIGTLKDQDEAVLLGNGSSLAKLKVYVYDEFGGRIPTISGTAAIWDEDGDTATAAARDQNGTVSRAATATATISEGVGEFTITAKAITADGTDNWTVKVTPSNSAILNEATATVRVVKDKLGKPAITDVSGGESGLPNRVLASDTFMRLGFAPISGSFGYVKVVRSTGAVIWTSAIVNLNSGYVDVPKSVLPIGGERYGIIVNNGAGDSTRSDLWPNDTAGRVVVEQAVKVDITGARYDAKTDRLYITTNTNMSGGTLTPSNLVVENKTTGYVQYLSGATCTISSSTITCANVTLDADLFNGQVRVYGENGWWINNTNGQTAVMEENLDNNWVYPSAYLTGMTIAYTYSGSTITGGTITLTGTNLDKGRINLGLLKIGTQALGSTTIAATGSTTATFAVNSTIANAIKALPGTSTLKGEEGWLITTANDQNGEVAGVALYANIRITAITYDATTNTVTVRGSGFSAAGAGGVDPSLFVIKARTGSGLWNLTGGTVAIVDDTTITVDFDDAANPAWEAGNSGKLLFGTEAGWLVTSDSWQAQGVTPQFRPTW